MSSRRASPFDVLLFEFPDSLNIAPSPPPSYTLNIGTQQYYPHFT